MSTTPIEVAEEALEKKVEAMKIVDRNSVETKNETDETKPEKRERKFGRMTDEQRRLFWEEEQRNKPVIETNLRGHVKWYSVLGHYGFISRDDGKPDIFVHQSAIIKSHTERIYLRTLADKEVVEFDLVEGKKGLEAANVRGPGGIEVKGSKYQRVLLYRNRPGKRIPERENTEQKEIKQNAEVEVKKEGRKLHRNRRFRKDYGERIDGQKEEINEEKTTVAVVEKKLSNRRHYSRRFRRPRKNTEGKDQDRLAYPIDDNIKAGSRRRMDSQSSLKTTDLRCNSALGGGDASLGATAIDAQV